MSGGPRRPCQQQQQLRAPVPVLSELLHLLPGPRPQPEIDLAVQPFVREGSRGLQAPEEPGDALSSKASWSEYVLSEKRLVVRDGPPTEGALRQPRLETGFGSTTAGIRR